MAIDVSDIITASVGLVASVVGFFVKRDMDRHDAEISRLASAIDRHGETLTAIQVEIAKVSAVGQWGTNLERFFGPSGGQARLWKTLEEIKEKVT